MQLQELFMELLRSCSPGSGYRCSLVGTIKVSEELTVCIVRIDFWANSTQNTDVAGSPET